MDTLRSFQNYAHTVLDALELSTEGKTTLAEVHGWSRMELEALYTVGYRLLACENRPAAREVFGVLCRLDHLTPHYQEALLAAAEPVAQPSEERTP